MGIMFVLFGICAIVALMVASSIWSGYVLSILWGWFIVPTFGLPMLSIPVAIGLALIVSYLTKQMAESRVAWGYTFSMALVVPLVALCMGYVVHSFM
jgi:Na+(H+)/acetate symporter ActP